jgi:hypothetical protein
MRYLVQVVVIENAYRPWYGLSSAIVAGFVATNCRFVQGYDHYFLEQLRCEQGPEAA